MNRIHRYYLKIYRKYSNKLYCFYLRTAVRNQKFTIISNNCWAGGVYEDMKLPYLTPTIGLFFFASDYIKFVKNLSYYLEIQLRFCDVSKHKEANMARINNNYPVGVLDDIEIHFLHYSSEKEALHKWNRRKQRVNYENLFLKFDDRDGATDAIIADFDSIENVRNKVVFSARKLKNIKSLVYLKKYKLDGMVGDLYTNRVDYRKHFSLVKWLNT